MNELNFLLKEIKLMKLATIFCLVVFMITEICLFYLMPEFREGLVKIDFKYGYLGLLIAVVIVFFIKFHYLKSKVYPMSMKPKKEGFYEKIMTLGYRKYPRYVRFTYLWLNRFNIYMAALVIFPATVGLTWFLMTGNIVFGLATGGLSIYLTFIGFPTRDYVSILLKINKKLLSDE